jgi:hypothetical protein
MGAAGGSSFFQGLLISEQLASANAHVSTIAFGNQREE